MKTQTRKAALRRQEAVRLRAQGNEPKEIAAILGVDPQTVYNYLFAAREAGRGQEDRKFTNATLYRRFLDDATAAVEEAKELAVKMHLGIVTQAGLEAATQGLRVGRHGEQLVKRARGAGLNGDGG